MTRVFEDLTVGEEYVTAARTVTEADIVAFAGVSGDFNPLHTDAEWVREHTDHPRPIAHGLLVLAISSGLRCPPIDELELIAYLEQRRRFVAPTLPGDTLRALYRVAETRVSRSKPRYGIVTLAVEVSNQRGELVQEGTDAWLVARRAGQGEA